MAAGISLANKIQLVFGCAVVAILIGVLAVPWNRTGALVRDFQLEEARRIADAWLSDRIDLGLFSESGGASDEAGASLLRLTYVLAARIDPDDPGSFVAQAMRAFRDDPEKHEYLRLVDERGQTVVRYARVIRESVRRTMRKPAFTAFSGPAVEPGLADPIYAILVVDRGSQFAEGQLLRIRTFIVAAGLGGSLLAMVVFWLILTRLIFRPVRHLRETTEAVRAGNLATRSQIRTGDEFEQLAEAFNSMLDRLGETQTSLAGANRSLDAQLSALAQANATLAEANRLKSEFLANVSHELRTPLNSIIGFAELLLEVAQADPQADPKRMRYLTNIITSGKSLLEMINELLDMAKIEAGRMEVNLQQTSVPDLLEDLVRAMKSQADAKEIEVTLAVAPRIPVIETDPGKLRQVLFNFLSNAIKFTPRGGSVVVSADRVNRSDHRPGIRLSVSDTGPGIPEDMHEIVFEKFRQIDASHTREHAGTGLGLAISRELARMLGATVSFVSAPGRGSTFFVDMPLAFQHPEPQALMG